MVWINHLILAGLVHPSQYSPQDPLSIGVFLESYLIPRLRGAHVEFPLALQRLENDSKRIFWRNSRSVPLRRVVRAVVMYQID